MDLDRLIISHEFMGDLNKLSRSQARLTASERLAYTGMDICEESSLQYEVCAGPLSRNIGTASSHPKKSEGLSNLEPADCSRHLGTISV